MTGRKVSASNAQGRAHRNFASSRCEAVARQGRSIDRVDALGVRFRRRQSLGEGRFKTTARADVRDLGRASGLDLESIRRARRHQPDADRVGFGVMMTSKGTVWIDSIDLAEFAPASAQPLSGDAAKYLAEAGWRSSRQCALLRSRRLGEAIGGGQVAASGATPAETHPAVAYLLRALKDNHSFLSATRSYPRPFRGRANRRFQPAERADPRRWIRAYLHLPNQSSTSRRSRTTWSACRRPELRAGVRMDHRSSRRASAATWN